MLIASERLNSMALAGRVRMSRILELSWLRLGPLDLAVPIGIGLIVGNALDQLGRPVPGIPFFVVPFAACWLALWLAIFAAGSIAFGSRARSGAALLLAQILSLWLLYDLLYLQQGNHLYDLNVYLGSAARWLDGGQAYLTAPLAAWPDGPRNDFFLYPPPLLPFFALLEQLPQALVAAAWTVAMVACSYQAFRVLGLGRGWSLALLAFPPVFSGCESGNVASLTFLLFAASVRAGGALVVDGLFKVQAGVPVLWLIRERRFRALVAGAVLVAVAVLITLPIVGTDAWRAWWEGLGYRATSQLEVPALFGYSYAREIPPVVYAVACAAFVALALAFRGRAGLAALGLASVFASPALWPHGFAFALPAVLLLQSDVAVLIVLGAGSLDANMWLLFFAGWAAVLAARRHPAGALHPMLGKEGPWPRRPITRPNTKVPTPFGARGQLAD